MLSFLHFVLCSLPAVLVLSNLNIYEWMRTEIPKGQDRIGIQYRKSNTNIHLLIKYGKKSA